MYWEHTLQQDLKIIWVREGVFNMILAVSTLYKLGCGLTYKCAFICFLPKEDAVLLCQECDALHAHARQFECEFGQGPLGQYALILSWSVLHIPHGLTFKRIQCKMWVPSNHIGMLLSRAVNIIHAMFQWWILPMFSWLSRAIECCYFGILFVRFQYFIYSTDGSSLSHFWSEVTWCNRGFSCCLHRQFFCCFLSISIRVLGCLLFSLTLW